MNLKITLTRDKKLKKLELRIPAVIYDQLLQFGLSPVELDLTTKEHFTLEALADNMGMEPEELLYCGFRVLEASRGDAAVRRDCLKMVSARRVGSES